MKLPRPDNPIRRDQEGGGIGNAFDESDRRDHFYGRRDDGHNSPARPLRVLRRESGHLLSEAIPDLSRAQHGSDAGSFRLYPFAIFKGYL